MKNCRRSCSIALALITFFSYQTYEIKAEPAPALAVAAPIAWEVIFETALAITALAAEIYVGCKLFHFRKKQCAYDPDESNRLLNFIDKELRDNPYQEPLNSLTRELEEKLIYFIRPKIRNGFIWLK